MGNRGLIYVLSGALVLALLAVAFLLGQRSAGPQVVWTNAPNPGTPDPPEAPTPPARRAVPTFADPPPEDVVLVRKNGTVSLVSPNNTAEPSSPAAAATAPPEVVDYLNKVARLNVGPVGTDQQAFAQQLLGEAMGGDLTSFDQLIRDAEASEKAVRAIAPPAGAEEHHRQLLDLLGESRSILRAEREALVSKDPTLLTSLLTRAQALEAKAKALAATEAQLRQGVGR